MGRQWVLCAIWLIAALHVFGALVATVILSNSPEFDFRLAWLYLLVVQASLCFCLFLTIGNAQHHAVRARRAKRPTLL